MAVTRPVSSAPAIHVSATPPNYSVNPTVPPVNAARTLGDLRSPPGNRLEPLHGDLVGFHSVRINDQWRLVFRWVGTDAHDVRLVDYH